MPRLARRFSVTDPPAGFTEPCWIWTAGQDGHGYGVVRIDGRTCKVHRVVYELLVGPIPEGLEIDHLCRVTLCAQPAHLEPVTHRENMARGMAPSHVARRTGRCIRGHDLTGPNVYTNPNGRGVECRACRNERSRVWHANH